jgi:hypothetical protein
LINRYFARHLFAATVFAAATLTQPTLAAASGHGFVHRQHTRIVDRGGKPIRLRGINLGNWLLIEPWMTGVDLGIYGGEDSEPDTFTDAIVDVVGKPRAETFLKAWRDDYVTEADIRWVKALGFNSVRVPLDYRLFYDKDAGKDVDTGFAYLDPLLRWCAQEKIYVIPDMHSVPGGKLIYKAGNIYSEPKKQELLAHIWQRIARRYAGNPWIGGWDLINEPGRWDEKHMALGELYKKLTGAIREVDKNHMIIVEGDHWASRVDMIGIGSDTAKPWDDNLAYSDHAYGATLSEDPDPKTGKYNPYLVPAHRLLTSKLDIPLWLGEFGYNSNPWVRTMINHAEKPKALTQDGVTADTPVDWCLWAYKAQAIWAPVCLHVPAEMDRLKAYWNARKTDPNAAKPDADRAFRILMQYAASTKLSACTTNVDVADALTRPDFSSARKPFNPNLTIPGRIDSVDYDMGDEGVAYHDTVSTDEAGKGPAGRAWNSGWNFRNDGVDVYPDTDGSPGFIVGEIETGEWIDYTVKVQPGKYTLAVRYSSPSGGGKMHIEVNGKDVGGPIDIPATGDWHKYQTLTVPATIKASGVGTMKLVFDTGGFNVNWVRFSK